MSQRSTSLVRVNVGCGATPTPGWVNFDNSLTVRLARVPGLVEVLARFGIIEQCQVNFARVVRAHGIRWANAARRIPLPDASAEVVYSSHMIEHLEPGSQVPQFLTEVRRVLVSGGIVRLVVPDLERLVMRYLERQDADNFVASLNMAPPRARGFFRAARFLVVGFRGHRWMYDGRSLVRLLERHGFCQVRVLPPGETMIPNPEPLNLREREEESLYVEARR